MSELALARARAEGRRGGRAHATRARTIVAVWRDGAPTPAIAAEVATAPVSPGGAACGDAIMLEAIGAARDWLPGNAERLALPDLPVCVWWVGDLPDFDYLFDRMVVGADLVIVNSRRDGSARPREAVDAS